MSKRVWSWVLPRMGLGMGDGWEGGRMDRKRKDSPTNADNMCAMEIHKRLDLTKPSSFLEKEMIRGLVICIDDERRGRIRRMWRMGTVQIDKKRPQQAQTVIWRSNKLKKKSGRNMHIPARNS